MDIDFDSARARLISQLSREIRDERVLGVMSRIPRQVFIPPSHQNLAYEDNALPISEGQTISQPYIVALMTQHLELTGSEKVLEIGTGSGYQTAILAEMARLVVTCERIPSLQEKAKKILDILGYTNIQYHLTPDRLGWKEDAPYDAILVAAAAPVVPDELMEQLAEGGRIVIPVGSRYTQELTKITKHRGGDRVVNLGPCRFVSLIGKGAWEEPETESLV